MLCGLLAVSCKGNTMLFVIPLLAVVATVSGLEPRFNVVTKNVTVTTGQTAVLPCSVDFLGTYKVVWLDHRGKLLTFEDRRIISDERISLERPYVKEWNLHVRNVRPTDDGMYTCQVNTDPVQIRPVFLNVHEPAKIINHLSSMATVMVKEGQTVELVCNVTGVPQPTVTWYRIPKGLMHDSDRHQDPDRSKKQIGVAGEVLVIHNVTRYCDDEYECVAFNNVPPAASRKMRVYVEFPPEVHLPNRKIGQSLGKTTILECIVTAYPHAVSVWRRNGQKIDRYSNKYNTEVYDEDENTLTLALRIQSLTREDYGDYQCVSENQLGQDSETMTLYEYKAPERTTTSTTTTTRRTSTRSPYNNGREHNGRPDSAGKPYYTHRPPQHHSNLPGGDRQPLVGGDNNKGKDSELAGQTRADDKDRWDPPYTYEKGNGPRNEQVIEPGSRGTTAAVTYVPLLLASVIVSLTLLR